MCYSLFYVIIISIKEMDFAKGLSLIKQIIHEISDMHIKILEICIYDTLYQEACISTFLSTCLGFGIILNLFVM